MLFLSRANRFKLNTNRGTVVFENGQVNIDDTKFIKAIKETPAFINGHVTFVPTKETNSKIKLSKKEVDNK